MYSFTNSQVSIQPSFYDSIYADPLGFTPVLIFPSQMSVPVQPQFNYLPSYKAPTGFSAAPNFVNLLPQNLGILPLNLTPTTPLAGTETVPTNYVSPNLQVPLQKPSLGCSSSVSSDANSSGNYKLVWSCVVPSQKLRLIDFQTKYQQKLEEAMRKLLGTSNLVVRLQVAGKARRSPKEFEIQWYCFEEEFTSLRPRIQRKDFQDSLFCQLVKIDDGAFNKFLDGAKQKTIIDKGYRSAKILMHALFNGYNGVDLHELQNIPEEQRFGARCQEILHRIGDDRKGNALRGPSVVGLRFKLQKDILLMDRFLLAVQEQLGVSKATMIPSLKKNKQYKGWSVYLAMETPARVEAVFRLCESHFGRLDSSQCFVAQDK